VAAELYAKATGLHTARRSFFASTSLSSSF
jgi:hypothetical protein